MSRGLLGGLAAVALVFAAVVSVAVAQDDAVKKKSIALGEAVPDFTLKALDGKEHKLSDFKGKTVVLDFISHGCPWSKAHDKTMPALAEKYKGNDVVVLGIDSDASHSVDDIAAYAKENNITYTILKDEGNKYADALNAKQTPEIFIVDKEGKLVYHGAYDNRKSPDQDGDTNYVESALDNLLAGEAVKTAQTKAWGCGIKRVG